MTDEARSIEDWLAEQGPTGAVGPQTERVVQVLARAPQFAGYASAREVAERAGVNVSTVVRTAQQYGFDGWVSLRAQLRSVYLTSITTGTPAPTDPAAQTLRQDTANLAALSTPENLAAIRAIAQAIRGARRTLVLSSGSGAGPAHILGHLGATLGHDIRPSVGPPTAQAVDVHHLGAGDCLITLNVWRLTRTLHELTRHAHHRGATVAVLTDLRSSPLAEDADHLVLTPIESIQGGPSLTAMVAAVQAILGELADDEGLRAAGEIQRFWEELNLMDDHA